MNGEERRQEILKSIKRSTIPLSGKMLAEKFHVSRQIIVQDIALLRKSDSNIVSTNKGYLYPASNEAVGKLYVFHKDDEIVEELNTIVDFGGIVEDVYVEHPIYGELRAELHIHNRKEAADFFYDIQHGMASPLKNITSGYHYHTVKADSEETLELIKKELKKKKILVSL